MLAFISLHQSTRQSHKSNTRYLNADKASDTVSKYAARLPCILRCYRRILLSPGKHKRPLFEPLLPMKVCVCHRTALEDVIVVYIPWATLIHHFTPGIHGARVTADNVLMVGDSSIGPDSGVGWNTLYSRSGCHISSASNTLVYFMLDGV